MADERDIKPATDFEVPVFKPKPTLKPPTTIKRPPITPTIREDPNIGDERR